MHATMHAGASHNVVLTDTLVLLQSLARSTGHERTK
jgi:hypothetical protein